MIFALLMVVALLGLLLATTVFAGCDQWSWSAVFTGYQDGHTVLEAVLNQDGADHGHSNTEWAICFQCDDLVSIQYQTAQMDEFVLLTNDEIECEDKEGEYGKLKVERTFEPSEAPIHMLFEIGSKSMTSEKPYWLKWATSTCEGSMEWFNCAPPTAITLASFDVRVAQNAEWPFGTPWPRLVLGLIIMAAGTVGVLVVLRRRGELLN